MTMKRKLNDDDVPVPSQSEESQSNMSRFGSLGLDSRLLQAIAKQNFNSPTEVQSKAIPLVLAGRNILARSKTGSGKTAAYILPILQSILQRQTPTKHTTALILVPTKELAQQATKSIAVLTAFCAQAVRTVNLTHKVPESVQRALLADLPDIIVSTPSRVVQNLQIGALSVDQLACLVIDEADLVLSYGYEDDLQVIANAIPNAVQTILMSATLTTEVNTLRELLCKDPVILDLKETSNDAGGVSQYVVRYAGYPVEPFTTAC